MKVPLSWLREFVDLDVPLAEVRRRFTMAGLEVEDVQQIGTDWQSVRLGRVTDLDTHPRRDGLTIARLDLADGSATVVTGATNLRVGDVVAHVAPGGRIAAGEIGRRSFAGIESEGMVLSGDEMGISSDHDGIYVFESDAPVGAALSDYLSEAVLDLYITANRPDCMSVTGIAREAHALFDAPYTAAMLRLLDPATARVDGTPGEPPVADLLSVAIDDPVGCPRFTASVVRNIAIGPSPGWMQRRLYLAGVRPISNVVDVTNYVMLELGQPLHAFDRQRLGSGRIVVRRAHPGERLTTLDAADRTLTPDMLVVTDGERARSLAGVMGGIDSEIADETHDVILEGASWDRATIRRTCGAVGLWSEASRRFGRGVDPELASLGVARATELTLKLAGGAAAAGLIDEYPGRGTPPAPIAFDPAYVTELLGLTVEPARAVSTLDSLGFGVRPDGNRLSVTVPSWRRYDVEGKADLAEEVGRVVGFDLVPATSLHGALPDPRPDGDQGYADEMRARQVLAAAGLQEVKTYSLIEPGALADLVVPGSGEPEAAIAIANPQSTDQSILRPTLLASVLRALRANLRQSDRVLLFELARTWHGELTPLPEERRTVAVAVCGAREPRGWSQHADCLDFYDVKGIVTSLGDAFRVDLSCTSDTHPSLHPGRTARVLAGDTPIGVIGQLHPTIAERFDLDKAPSKVVVAELDFERLLAARQPLLIVQTPSRFPSSDRDVSFFVDAAVSHADVESTIREAAGDLLESVVLFDVYRGLTTDADRKSLAFSLRYRSSERTLDDDEVSQVHGRVESVLRDRFGAEVRGR